MIKNYLHIELTDDNTTKGGISFVGETVKDFLQDTDLKSSDSLEKLNKELVACGIEPIITLEEFIKNDTLVETTFEYDIENELSLEDTKKLRLEYLYSYYLNNKRGIDKELEIRDIVRQLKERREALDTQETNCINKSSNRAMVCPMCEEGVLKHEEVEDTHVYTCTVCPFVGLENYSTEDVCNFCKKFK